MGKIMFCVQYYPYQYEQFKLLINKLNADAYYKSDLTNGAEENRRLSRDFIYDIEGNEYTLEDIKKKEYDYLIYTGPCRSYINSLAMCTRYKYCIYLSHSLVGTQYDVSISMPYHNRSIGIMPSLWTKMDPFYHIKYLHFSKNRSWRSIESKSNPIVAQVLEKSPEVDVEKDVLGVIFGEKSPFETSKKLILENIDRLGIKKVKIKFHPLTEQKDMNLFKGIPNIEILPTNMYKYDFTDSCEYLLGGASSLLVESLLRNKYFNRNQKFMKLKMNRGIDVDLPLINNFDKNKNYDFTLYDSMIMSPENILQEHINIIDYIENNYI